MWSHPLLLMVVGSVLLIGLAMGADAWRVAAIRRRRRARALAQEVQILIQREQPRRNGRQTVTPFSA